jgi:hypothetical protein
VGAFSDLRDTLAADLAALDVPVHPAWPDTLVVPCVFLTPPLGGEYVTAGPTFGGYTMAVDVVILVGHAQAGTAFAALEHLIETVLINTVDWSLDGVDSPSPISVTDGGAEYLGTVIHLSKTTRLN